MRFMFLGLNFLPWVGLLGRSELVAIDGQDLVMQIRHSHLTWYYTWQRDEIFTLRIPL